MTKCTARTEHLTKLFPWRYSKLPLIEYSIAIIAKAVDTGTQHKLMSSQ